MIAPYTAWLLAFNVLPLLALWMFFYDDLKTYWETVLKCIGCSIVGGVAWDIAAIRLHIWYWPASCCSLPRVGGLPLEEPLFMAFTTALIATMTLVARDIVRTHHYHKKRAKR